MKYICCLAVLVLLVALCQASVYTKCQGKPSPTGVRVKGCTQYPCKFTKGDHVVIDYDFVVPRPITSLKPLVSAKFYSFFGTTINRDPKVQGCNSLLNGARCPLRTNQTVTYHIDREVECTYASGRVDLEYKLYDQDNKLVLCTIFPLVIQSKSWYC